MSSRRKFLKTGATAALAGSAISCTGNKSGWECLTDEEAATVEAICGQLIPADQDPGAAWAGVVRFIDRQLAGFYKRHRQAYRDGLAAVNRTAMLLDGAPFAALPSAKQADILSAMEKRKAPPEAWGQQSARDFFDLILAHTMQGFYGSPRHGGNRDAVSWHMLGVSVFPVRGRAHFHARAKG